jgi:hypothetical protein
MYYYSLLYDTQVDIYLALQDIFKSFLLKSEYVLWGAGKGVMSYR